MFVLVIVNDYSCSVMLKKKEKKKKELFLIVIVAGFSKYSLLHLTLYVLNASMLVITPSFAGAEL